MLSEEPVVVQPRRNVISRKCIGHGNSAGEGDVRNVHLGGSLEEFESDVGASRWAGAGDVRVA